MGTFRHICKAVLRTAAVVAAVITVAACTDLYEEGFHINGSRPEIKRPENAILADTPNKRRVFVLFSFGYNNLSYDLKEDVEDIISSGVPGYGFEEDVVLVLSQNTKDTITPSRLHQF